MMATEIDRPMIFYKYYSVRGLLQTLGSMKIRCSSPVTFNDPFDMQMDPFNLENIKVRIEFIRLANDFIFADHTPAGHPESSVYKFLLTQREKRDRYADSKMLRLFWGESLHRFNGEIFKIREWVESYFLKHRVFCVAEDYKNLLMWAHYAEQHKGAVIGYKPIEHGGTGLDCAIKVDYSHEIPQIFSPHDLAQGAIGAKDIYFQTAGVSNNFVTLACTKSKDWEYESEWRSLSLPDNSSKDFDLRPISPEEINSIYLGCRMDKATRNNIFKLLVGKLRHVRAYQCDINKKEFKLNYPEV